MLGPPTGYVVKFTNGLTAYLSGDTGIHTEMKTVVNEYPQSEPRGAQPRTERGHRQSGAYAMNDLVRPASVILTHLNEAVTEGGKLRPASRTAALIKQLKATRASCHQRPHDGVRRQGQVRRRMLSVTRSVAVKLHRYVKGAFTPFGR